MNDDKELEELAKLAKLAELEQKRASDTALKILEIVKEMSGNQIVYNLLFAVTNIINGVLQRNGVSKKELDKILQNAIKKNRTK